MIRGFLTGVIWGGVVASAGLAVISQVSPLPGTPSPAVAVPDDAPAPPPEILDKTPEPVAEPVPDTARAPAPVAALDLADDTPALPAAPDAAPVTGIPQLPEAAAQDAATAPLPLPAEPPGRVVDAPASPALIPLTLPTAPPTALADAVPGLTPPPMPALPETEPTPPSAEPPPPLEEALLQPVPQPEPELPALIVPADPAPADPAPADPAPAEPAPADPVPDAVVPDAPLPTLPRLITPDSDTTLGDDAVPTNRLPRIGDAPAATEPDQIADLPPLDRYARAFTNPEAKPLFALVLIDTGAADLDRARLAALPFPVSFVIDPLAPNAAEAAALYRAAGQEVVMRATGIPEGATAADLEQTFQAHDRTLTEAVAVVDLGAGGFQDNRPLATEVVPVIKAQGRGLLTYERGLNAADQVARREGVPAARIFRSLDDDGESIPVIRRYLDRAAFKAAQEGRVVVIGTARPETVAGILEWTIEGRASSVALAPVSAVLQAP